VRGYLSNGLVRIVAGAMALVLLTAVAVLAESPALQGTYKLVSRQLPDGTTKSQPDVMGLLTFTSTHRTLNVVWKGPNDIISTYSLASTYKLESGKYTEKVLFSSLNDHMAGQKPTYDLVAKNQTVRVVTGEMAAAEKPHVDVPTMIIDGNKITTTAEGSFIDTWERIEGNTITQAENPE